MQSLSYLLSELMLYAKQKNLLREEDEAYVMNGWLSLFKTSELLEERAASARALEEILEDLCDTAGKMGIIDGESTVMRDLFDTALMGVITPRPSEVIDRFRALYSESPAAATSTIFAPRAWQKTSNGRWIRPTA